jgi:uncharacterized paraquat-inducible protein A
MNDAELREYEEIPAPVIQKLLGMADAQNISEIPLADINAMLPDAAAAQLSEALAECAECKEPTYRECLDDGRCTTCRRRERDRDRDRAGWDDTQ